uniref:Trafficking protein particle complex subunit 13 n=1 Tax=Pelusios castaneus TaxID=367368 RepID=A0A8C8S1Q1_9SAUR
MEVVLHYRPFQNDLTKLQKLAEETLKEFPIQQLPRFIPWFPNDSHKLPLKPKRQPPFISVMRLTKPTLFTNIPVTCEERDLPGELFNQLMKDDPSTVKGAETLMLGEMLTLPQNFGNIFLGETFSSYISVHNDSNQVVKDILVKADLQTSSQRLNLSASSAAVAELKSDCCIDDVIHHEVKEIGTHILVCAVSYTTQTGEKMYFRKFFKFQVLKPLDVKTKFYNAETDEVFLEAQIQNITTSPMFMEKVSLEPSIMYNVAELNTVNKGGESVSTFGSRTYLQPMDTRQYLYCLKPKQEFAEKAGVIKGVTVIGKLDIVWKTNLGERGRLQTSQLQRMAPGYGDVRLSLETIPDTVNLEEPFDITCKITNCSSERTMDLVLEMCNTNSIHWCGVSGRQLGKLHPSSSLHLALTLLSSVQGLQSVSGLRLTDTFLKRTYEYDDIAQVCVISSKVNEERG